MGPQDPSGRNPERSVAKSEDPTGEPADILPLNCPESFLNNLIPIS